MANGGSKKKRERVESVSDGPVRETRSVTAPKRQKLLDDAARVAEEKADALRAQREEALRNQPAAPAGNRGDGTLHVAFIQMGQGDCTLISTPGGRVIMIDCGSDSTEQDTDDFTNRVKGVIGGPKFLKNLSTLDILILTHPNTDHYAKLSSILRKDIKIFNFYHSASSGSYSVGSHAAWIYKRLANSKFDKAVTINDIPMRKVNSVNIPPASNAKTVDCLDARGALRIVDEPNCKVSILVSNVATSNLFQDNSDWTNRGSVVTLVEAFNKKLVITGDATTNTEAVLMNLYKNANIIRNVDVLQIPHHGSTRTSSHQAFATQMRPTMAMISAGKDISMHHLPMQEAADRYLGVMANGAVPSHEIFYWPGSVGSYGIHTTGLFTTKALYTTGSNLTQEIQFAP